MIRISVIAMVVAGAAIACSSNDSTPAPAAASGDSGAASACAVPSTFSGLYTKLFSTPTCATGGCHAAPGANGLAFDGSAAATYAQLVNATSVESSLDRVTPGQPDASYLYVKVSQATPAAGTRMPQSGAPLDACTIDAIKAWIAAGAPND